jgi:hypothetical protein
MRKERGEGRGERGEGRGERGVLHLRDVTISDTNIRFQDGQMSAIMK